MTLGERISNLRKAKSLSQEDLASILNISRQAVYKWESDQSIPELDKLVAMSDIFDVSLDELVKGDKLQSEDNVEGISNQVKTNDKHVIIGVIFLGFGVLVSLTMNIVYGLLFIVPGLVCLLARKQVVLKCVWAAYIWFDYVMRFTTGIDASMISRTSQWTEQMNYVRLAIAWLMFILMIVMIVVTVRAMIKNQMRSDKDVIIIIASVILLLIVRFFPLGDIIKNIPSKYINSRFVFWLNHFTALLSLIKTWLVIIILGKLIPIIKGKIKNKS